MEDMRHPWIWIPPVVTATAIFWLSQQPGQSLALDLPTFSDKVAHAFAFGLLAFTLDRAFRKSRHDWPMYRRHLWVFLLVAAYGASDEWHQSFIFGRDTSVFDWLADVVGAVLGISLATLPFILGKRTAEFGWWRGTRERPDPGRPLVLVADPHWGEELTGLREITRRYPEADWLFLGDVFDVWVGLPGMETEPQRSFLWWVQERRAGGRWIGLWMGNREYFLDRLSHHFDLLGEGLGGALPAEGLVFEHGDLINRADRRYRFWNVISRSAFTWLVVGLMPPWVARRLAMRLEEMMRTTNLAYRLSFPHEAFTAAAAEAPEAVFLSGHFHTHHTEGEGISLPWAHEGGFALWHEGKLELLAAPIRPEAPIPLPTHP